MELDPDGSTSTRASTGSTRRPPGVFREGDKLFAQRSGGEKQETLPFPRRLLLQDRDSRIRFRRDAAGKITGMDLLQRGPRREAARPTSRRRPSARRCRWTPGPVALCRRLRALPGVHDVVTREGDQLMAQATGQPSFEVFPESETKFFLKVVDAQIDFIVDAAGVATGLVLHQGGRDVAGRRSSRGRRLTPGQPSQSQKKSLLVSALPSPRGPARRRGRASASPAASSPRMTASCSSRSSVSRCQYSSVPNCGQAAGKAGSCQRRASQAA